MSVRENLIAARALIDTPEKYDDKGILDALLGNGVSIDMFNQMRDTLLAETNGDVERITVWVRGKYHSDIMDLFDRAIAAQDRAIASTGEPS
jgi:hypothetical protein